MPSCNLRGSRVLKVAIAANFIAKVFAGFCAYVAKVYELLGARFPITPKGVGQLSVLHETPPAEFILPDSITQRKDRLNTYFVMFGPESFLHRLKEKARLGGGLVFVFLDDLVIVWFNFFIAAGTAIVAQTIPFVVPLGSAGAGVVLGASVQSFAGAIDDCVQLLGQIRLLRDSPR